MYLPVVFVEWTVMNDLKYNISAELWIYPGKAGWHFVTIPKEESQEIESTYGGESRGWGSLPVTVTIGKTEWNTSIFPDKRAGTYLLPVKAEVRKKEDLSDGDTISLVLEVRV